MCGSVIGASIHINIFIYIYKSMTHYGLRCTERNGVDFPAKMNVAESSAENYSPIAGASGHKNNNEQCSSQNTNRDLIDNRVSSLKLKKK